MGSISRQGPFIPRQDPRDFVIDFSGAFNAGIRTYAGLQAIELRKQQMLNQAQQLENMKQTNQLNAKRIELDSKAMPSKLRAMEADAEAREIANDRNRMMINQGRQLEEWRVLGGMVAQNDAFSNLTPDNFEKVLNLQQQAASTGNPLIVDDVNKGFRRWDNTQRKTADGRVVTGTQMYEEWKSKRTGGAAPATRLDVATEQVQLEAATEDARLRAQGLSEDQIKARKTIKNDIIDQQLSNALTVQVWQRNRQAIDSEVLQEIERLEITPGTIGDKDPRTFGNFGDLDFNAAMRGFAKSAIEQLDAGALGQGLTVGERNDLKRTLRTIEGISRAPVWNWVVSPVDNFRALIAEGDLEINIDKIAEFERKYRQARQAPDRTAATDKVTQEFWNFLTNELTSGRLDQLLRLRGTLQRRVGVETGQVRFGQAIDAGLPVSQTAVVEGAPNAAGMGPGTMGINPLGL